MNYGEGGLSASDVALINGSGRNSDGFGDNNSWWVVLFLIVLFGGWGRGGYGGFGGGNGGTSTYEGYTLVSDFSQLSRQLADATAMTERKLDGVNNGLCSLGYQELQNINGVNMNIANATAGIQNTLTQGFSGINTGMVQQGYETRNAITQGTIAEMQNTNAIQTQLASCCLDKIKNFAGNLKRNFKLCVA